MCMYIYMVIYISLYVYNLSVQIMEKSVSQRNFNLSRPDSAELNPSRILDDEVLMYIYVYMYEHICMNIYIYIYIRVYIHTFLYVGFSK
jgi:hypothetical protein